MMPKHIDLYKALHQTKEQLPCSENAKAILDAYEKKKAEDDALASQMMSGSSCDIETHPQSIDDNERFLDVIGPPKKGRWTSVQTESSFIPIKSIHRFASVTLTPPIQVSDDNRVAERVHEIIQSTLNNTIRNVVLEIIGDILPGTRDDVVGQHIDTTDGDEEEMTGTNEADGNEHVVDDGIADAEENRVGVDNNQFVINLLS